MTEKRSIIGPFTLVVVNDPEGWTECKRILINRYSDPSSEKLLFNKLSVCYQKANQSLENYADEIKFRLNRLKEHTQLNNEDRQVVNMKISFYENVAKNTFINGIKEPYHSFLTHFELDDIEDCLNKCTRHDNHEQQANFLSYMRQRESKPKANLFNAPNFGNNNFGNNNFGNTFRQNNNNNNQAIPQNYQPTPMSISTRNTNRPGGNQTNRPNNLQNNSVPGTNNFFRST